MMVYIAADDPLPLIINPNVQNEDGETALKLAEGPGLVKVIERLRSRAG